MFISPHNGFSLGAYYCKLVTGDEGYKITKNKSTVEHVFIYRASAGRRGDHGALPLVETFI
jgi:hypothetical protein